MELVDHPDGAAHLGAWYAIVESASKQKVRGYLPGGISQDVGGICRALGKISQLPSGIFEAVIPRLLKIGWLEQVQENQRDTKSASSLAENPNVLAENPNEVALQDITGQNITGHEKTKILGASAPGECFALSSDPPSSVRPAVSAKAQFEIWWKGYWNKTGKPDAEKAFIEVLKESTLVEMQQRLAGYIDRFKATESWSWRKNQHPCRWIKKRAWEDESPPDSEDSGRRVYRREPMTTGERVLERMQQRIANGDNPL